MVARTVKVKVQNRALCIERYKQHAVVCFIFFAASLTEDFNVFVLSGPRAIQVYRLPRCLGWFWELKSVSFF